MKENKWCIVVEVDNKFVLFYQEYDAGEDQYIIHQIARLDGCQVDVKVQRHEEWVEKDFIRIASVTQAKKILDTIKRMLK